MVRRPAAILGHTFPTGAAMTVTIPWAAVVFAAFEAACIVAGALLGVAVVLVRMAGEARRSIIN